VEAPAPTVGPTTLLNEVAFLGGEGALPFVEIKLGHDNLTGLKLRNEAGLEYPLPAAALQGSTGPLLLVLFDGQGDQVDLRTVHAANASFLNPTSGEVSLMAPDGTVLDQIAWGDRPDAVSGGVGRIRPPRPGDALIRIPQSTEPGGQYWYLASTSTPGQSNPNPTVGAVYRPLPGQLILAGEVAFGWYRLSGSSQYRVQVAADRSFDPLILDVTGSAFPRLSLEAGTYVWRVQAIAQDGTPSDFTTPLPFRVVEESPPTLEERRVGSQPALQSRSIAGVPLLLQRKDTRLLCLESTGTRDEASHSWDRPHPLSNEGAAEEGWSVDPCCATNCWAACLQMINHYFAGTVSQDRITYEVYHERAAGVLPYQDGPERDFCYNDGVENAGADKGMRFALGGVGGRLMYPTRDDLWSTIKTEVEADRPCILAVNGGTGQVSGHAVVVVGWRVARDVGRVILVNNPAVPFRVEELYLDEIPVITRFGVPVSLLNLDAVLELVPAQVTAFTDELSVRTDTDQDGVYDFDEVERFKTDPARKDSDLDCIDDKAEILSTMFRADYDGPPLPKGQFFYYNLAYTFLTVTTDSAPGLIVAIRPLAHVWGLDLSQTSRDPDRDFKRSELDQNSDRGLLPDFLEDSNRNGLFEAGETSPLVDSDDRLHITGTYNLDQDRTTTGPAPQEPGTVTLRTTNSVQATYDITITGERMTGGVTIRESNKMSHYTYDFDDPTSQDFEVFVNYDPRTWTTELRFTEWYCNFFEAAQGPVNDLTFQVLVEMEEDGRGVPGRVTNLEVPPGTNREGVAAQRVTLPIFLDFKDGRYTFDAGTERADLTVTH
jgi:hypothetical protein